MRDSDENVQRFRLWPVESRGPSPLEIISRFSPAKDLVEVITPLYGFGSDYDELKIGRDTFILRFRMDLLEQFVDEDTQSWSFFRCFQPNFVIWQRILRSGTEFTRSKEELNLNWEKVGRWLGPAWLTVRHLRLFKPGLLKKGPSWVLLDEDEIRWESYFAAQGVHLESLLGSRANYHFNAEEIPQFEKFVKSWTELHKSIDSDRLMIALAYLENSHESKSEKEQLIDLSVALEALLLNEKQELSFKLASRGANLLGRTAEDRKFYFAELKRFYDVRSKIVHGESLKAKQANALQHVEFFREITRYLLLAATAASASGRIAAFPASLDELSLDENLRENIHAFILDHFDLNKRPACPMQTRQMNS